MAQRFVWRACDALVRCAPVIRPVRNCVGRRPFPGARWYLPSTSYCTTSTGEEGEGDSKETSKADDLSQKLESFDELPIKLEEMVNSVSSIPNEVSKDQSSILDEDDKDVLAQTFSKSLCETSSSDDYPDDYKKNFQAFFEHEQQQIVQREADEFKRLTEDPNFESSHLAMDEESGFMFADEDMESLDLYPESQDPRDKLDSRRTARDVQRLSSQRMDTRQYLNELEKLPILFVRCAQNNTYIDICDHTGRILTWKSAGSIGFKKSRRGTTFAAQSVGQVAALKAGELGFKKVRVKLKGLGIGRQHSLKGFQLGGLEIMSIQDVTPVPHNGCRPKKKRRV